MGTLTNLNLAILALDSYNRGYDANTQLSGTSVGSASILLDSLILNQDPNDPNRVDEAASFYAIAYQTTGGVVISYRGTDAPLADWDTGWTTGAGMPEMTVDRPV